MLVYFSGIGGSGISALAHFCLDLGYQVAGSDINLNQNTEDLTKRGATIFGVQTSQNFQQFSSQNKIDWFVYSSSINSQNQEYQAALSQKIPACKRDGLINFLLQETGLDLVAVCGTHGKSTTTSMLSWLFEKLQIPYSHLIGTNLSWANSGKFSAGSKVLFLEADEYDKNFLNYFPKFSLLTAIDYDHPDTYPTQADYFLSFNQFFSQSKNIFSFQDSFDKLNYTKQNQQNLTLLDKENLPFYTQLLGLHNRQNANLVLVLAKEVLASLDLKFEDSKLLEIINNFPGTSRRQEKIYERVYSDYAHHPVEIAATLSAFKEVFPKLVVVYQPHQNIRQHQIKQDYANCFDLADQLFWLPTFLSREDPNLEILTPEYLTKFVKNTPTNIANLDVDLEKNLLDFWQKDYLILFFGAGDVDNWAREFVSKNFVEN